MLKWKSRTEITNIGVLELGNITFDEDYMEVSIDICDMSDELKEEVEKAIEIGKVNRTREIEKFNREHGFNIPSVWSDKPVKIDFTYLRVVIRENEAIRTTIEVGFTDSENEKLEQMDCSIAVDLSDYTEELKKAIIKILVDKFF